MAEYLLPDVGEGLTEAEIVSWKVKEGDTVAINEVIVEIETAKSLVELPSPYEGVVSAILVAEGTTVPVGTPIIAIGDAASTTVPVPETAGASEIDLSNPGASGMTEGESLVGRARPDRAATRRLRRRAGAERAGEIAAHADVMDSFNLGGSHQHEHAERLIETLLTPEEQAAADEAEAVAAAARPQAKPPVRKLAKDLGVDLATVAGSGPDGVVTRADIEAAAVPTRASASTSAPTRPADDRPREWREPVKGVRKMMAQAMSESAFTAPHVTEWVTVDATRSMELVDRLRRHPDFADTKVSPMLVLAWACLHAIRRTPEINSTWDEAAQEVVFKSYVNLGIAAATPRGLVVPNVKDAQDLSLRGLADAITALTATAREGRTQPAEMSGGTFTITNVGVFGIDSGTPIINPGESAILAFGAVRKQPWVVSGPAGDEIAIRQVTTLALSFD
ncbi:MAG: 2-oxo acid dehydrogenase subunit E2, partial [Nocardioidaceae bacterium]|nr:2-oxo acid dehydrogenase subunit E2 [Nocardioidaceae bacterium]